MKTIDRLPTHPGDVLKEELECRKISQKKFSQVLGVSYTMLNEILNGKRPVTSDFALMIEAALNINAELLINMQTRYNLAVSRKENALANKLYEIRKLCASLL
ncbi:HigA family addiction module antitoxin [Bacteroides sp.]|uniref:HigA family addiction module antitoxin n=1 Tax=Bacteroides sp. TaxID=29523 RepID=UPI00260BA409|nr:HigA family addiction module antitoxin [Bacteroides sp.]